MDYNQTLFGTTGATLAVLPPDFVGQLNRTGPTSWPFDLEQS
jgi:hypothetical protein